MFTEKSLGGRAYAKALAELLLTAVSYPCNLRSKSFNVILLLLKKRFGNEHRHIYVFVTKLLEASVKNLLDVFHSIHYMQPLFVKMNPDVVGIAENEEAAKELVVQITEDVYRETGSFDVRSYFKFQE